jgi:hypothetical protein
MEPITASHMNVVDVFGLTYVGRDDASILIRTQAFYRSLPCTSAISSASSGTDLLVGAMVVIGDRDDAISAAAGGGVSCQGTGAKAYMVTGVTWVEEDGPAISPITHGLESLQPHQCGAAGVRVRLQQWTAKPLLPGGGATGGDIDQDVSYRPLRPDHVARWELGCGVRPFDQKQVGGGGTSMRQ